MSFFPTYEAGKDSESAVKCGEGECWRKQTATEKDVDRLSLRAQQVACNSHSFTDHKEALNLHNNLECAQADQFRRAHETVIHSEMKQGWRYRVAILKELIKAKFEYEIRWGDLKGTHIKLDIGTSITDGQKQDMVNIMVDKETLIWQGKGLISDKLYNDTKRDTHKYLFSRGTFRTRRRELWMTAAKNLQQEMDKQFLASSHTCLGRPKYQVGGAAGRKDNGGRLPSFTPGNPSKGETGKQQLKQWQRRFAAVRKLLTQGSFLNAEYHCDRDVNQCPVLIAEHKAKGRSFTNTNVNQTCSEVGLFEAKLKNYITPLSEENEETLTNYLNYLHEEFEAKGRYYLGPHFVHEHEGAGFVLHMQRGCSAGHFIVYTGECTFEGDRNTSSISNKTPDDLFALVEHISGRDEWGVCLDPTRYSNFARYVAGVSPKNLNDANCFAYTVAAAGFYHIIIVAEKRLLPGVAPQYYYRGLKGEEHYKKIPDVPPPPSLDCKTKEMK